jgi:hypothetical protein
MQRPLRVPPLRLSLIAVFSILVLALGVLEIRHHSQYGHFVPYGLHADVTVSEGETGMPGITRMFDAHLTSFSVFPETIERCEFVSDAGAHGASVAYRLEQLDTGAHRWKTLFDTAGSYCRPYPLGSAQSKLVDKRLWPGQTLSIGSEAPAARGKLKGKTMRFVIEANGRKFPTGPYMIIEVGRDFSRSR